MKYQNICRVAVSQHDGLTGHFVFVQIGLLSALPPVIMTVVVIIAGIVVDRLIRGNYVSRTLGRKAAQTLGK